MNVMTVTGASHIIVNGLEYEGVNYLETTEAYHYFTALVLIEGQAEPMKNEVRIDRNRNIDGQFHIQGRPWGSEYWEDIDSVYTDWLQEE